MARWGADLATGAATSWTLPIFEQPLGSAQDIVRDLERELEQRLAAPAALPEEPAP